MAKEAAAIRAGPIKNLITIEIAAKVFPQAMILGCNAANMPNHNTKTFFYEV